ncbi:hypothetical protein [Pseudomonas viridiflava]|uniref:hypothetical protein n=1 Tax=Pseudomonas viridiflava TaxID=33069 RepID=UPI000F02AA9C|nr:hypothetical protein [Pseudomonas viridiflava]
MAKESVPKVYEPDEGKTHYGPPPGLDQVTLCGIPDWLGGRTPGQPTAKMVNCFGCKQIVDFVQSSTFK